MHSTDNPDPDNPPLSEAQLARLVPARDVPEKVARLKHKAGRGPQRAPKKVLTTVRLDADLVAALKADEPKGWHGRLNAALRKGLGL